MRRAACALILLAACATACGKKGPPRPPEPRGPLPPQQVEARQEGSDVVVSFIVPHPRGASPSQVLWRAELARVEYASGSHPGPDADGFRRRGRTIAVAEQPSLEPGSRRSLVDATLPSLPHAGVGTILRYGVRVFDPHGRPSTLVIAADLEPVEALPPPTDLAAAMTGDGIRLTWAPPAGRTDLLYNVYRSTAEQSLGTEPINHDPIDTPEYLDASVEAEISYVYEVRTSAPGPKPRRESTATPAVSVLARDRFAPAAPERLVAVQEGVAIRLLWNPNPESDLAGYHVYRRRGAEDWTRVGPDLVDHPAYLDAEVRIGEHLAYRVTAVDRAKPPNEGPPSEVAEADVAAEPGSLGGTP